jgi:uncharacterized protein (TIGR02246 family)
MTAMLMVAMQSGAADAPRGADEAAIRARVPNYTEARTAEASQAIEALFTADADQHTSAGEWRCGREQVVPGTLGSAANNPGTRRIDIGIIRFVTDDIGIVDGPYVVGEGASQRRYWTMTLPKRQASVWRISAIRNMLPTAGSAR